MGIGWEPVIRIRARSTVDSASATPPSPRPTSERRNAVHDASDFGRGDRAAQDLALAALVDGDGDEEGGVQDAAAVALLLALSVEPQIRIARPVQSSVAESAGRRRVRRRGG